MNRNTSFIIIILLCIFPMLLPGQNNINQPQTSFVYQQLSTPDPSPEAVALFRYLQYIFGEKILSGQMSDQQGNNELDYIMNIAVKKPAIQGFDFALENANEAAAQNAVKWWNDGGIPLIMWQWGAPTTGEGYENSTKEISIEKCLQEGTPEHSSFMNELKTKADHLEKLRDANVPVLWCPFHEQNGNLFWWGKQGPAQFIMLWQTMFNYFTTERNLNNLIWVTSFSENANKDWFPGNDYVDIIGAGSYKNVSDPQKEIFEQAKTIANSNTSPVAYNECATIPDPEQCKKNGVMWSWWMQRPGSYLTNINQSYLSKVYHDDLIITLDELPDIVKDFSSETVKRYYYSGASIPFDNFKGFNLGVKSSGVIINNKRMEIEAKGNGFQGTKDDGYFTFEQIEGDFDISVKVTDLTPTHLYTMAGIMAREDLSRKSPHIFFHVFSNNSQKNRNSGGCELKYRTEDSNQTQRIYPDPENAGDKFDVVFPDTWIRLKRKGNIFKSYISHDNINWSIYSVHTQKMPEKLLVGLAVSSGNENKSTIAEFEDLEITWD